MPSRVCSPAHSATRRLRRTNRLVSFRLSPQNRIRVGTRREANPARRFACCWTFRITRDLRSTVRSEERREGKSVDLGGRRIIKKKKDKSIYKYSIMYKLH